MFLNLYPGQETAEPSSITLKLKIPDSFEEDWPPFNEEFEDKQIDSDSEASEGMESDLGNL